MTRMFIYGLIDPRTDEQRYIGGSAHPEERFRQHIRCEEGTPRGNWIRELYEQGLEPRMEILEATDTEHWATAERQWIARAQRAGCDLFNSDPQLLEHAWDSIPADTDSLTWNQLLELARSIEETGSKLALGALVQLGLDKFRRTGETARSFQARFAKALGCVRVTLTRALMLYRSPVDIPEGLDPTKALDILCREKDPQKLEEAFSRALSEGWIARDIREMKRLQKQGLLDGWRKVRLTLGDDGSLSVVTSDGATRCFGKVDTESQDRLVIAAISLLKDRAIS